MLERIVENPQSIEKKQLSVVNRHPKTAVEILDAVISLGEDIENDLREDGYAKLARWLLYDPSIPGKTFSREVYDHTLERGYAHPHPVYHRQPFWGSSTNNDEPLEGGFREWTLNNMTKVSDEKITDIKVTTFHVSYSPVTSEEHYWPFTVPEYVPSWLAKTILHVQNLVEMQKGKESAHKIDKDLRELVERKKLTTNTICIYHRDEHMFSYKDKIFLMRTELSLTPPMLCVGMGVYDVNSSKPVGYVLFGTKNELFGNNERKKIEA